MKNNIVKKVLAASLATVMTVGLAACGNDPAPTTGSDTPSPFSFFTTSSLPFSLFFFFLGMVLLHSSGWSGTQYIAQTSL